MIRNGDDSNAREFLPGGLGCGRLLSTVRCIWQFQMYLAVSGVFGTVGRTWHCQVCMALTDVYGTARCIWHCRV